LYVCMTCLAASVCSLVEEDFVCSAIVESAVKRAAVLFCDKKLAFLSCLITVPLPAVSMTHQRATAVLLLCCDVTSSPFFSRARRYHCQVILVSHHSPLQHVPEVDDECSGNWLNVMPGASKMHLQQHIMHHNHLSAGHQAAYQSPLD